MAYTTRISHCIPELSSINHEKIKNTDEVQMEEKKTEVQAFIEHINFTENSVDEDDFWFQLSRLYHKYADHLPALVVQKEVDKVCFKEKVLGNLPQGQV
ncbi:hypothetical protein NDU88_001791 [Pleurodeles waltl]|uniref:Uncharacterized protein n=1 Tax=Pleurodeles waltl TaxID=8319 RepID=A0AAV7TL45_PLEWA|nr:hypothetical protein NDU88_001791 [Pleurodeles waltl]